MSQLTLCDLCRELIKQGDQKFLFGYYAVVEENDETKKERFEELLKELYKGRTPTNAHQAIKIYEICPKCVGVFAKCMTLREEDLQRARKEVQKLLSRKSTVEKKKTKKEEMK